MAPRKCLTLKENFYIIEYHKREKCTAQKLSEVFKIGKTQESGNCEKRRANN